MRHPFFRILPASLLILGLLANNAYAQTNPVRCYPTHWWVNMKDPGLQIMLHGTDIGKATQLTLNYPGVQLTRTHSAESPNYLFVDLTLSPQTAPGTLTFRYRLNDNDRELTFELRERRPFKGNTYAQGVTTRDFIYLIMPDRFSNGDPTNDRIPGMRDQSLRRDTVFNRHGGDLKGIQNHLDYLFNLGVTALWLNPVWENDMPDRTEHGYAFTNHYQVDPRLGGNAAYHELVRDAHAKGMKVIQDAVYNHVGRYHFTVQDPPLNDWLNQWPRYTNTTYKDQPLFDPYASPSDRKKMSDGWFTPNMPDLNQRNPFVARFLIQHALWSVEEFGIDGWRIDTYAYNDLDFMNRCNQALLDEYPQITLFGETWVHGVPNQSYFCENRYNIPYKSNLPGVTDFQTLWGITATMNEDFGWTSGVNKLYTTLAQDFVYKDATRNVIFLDNHDIARFYSVVGENLDKYRSSLCWLLTSRGIPQLYYGSELATTGTTSPSDGYVRLDFPGGWPGDTVNKFTIQGRNQKDQAIFQDLATLALFRKRSSALTTGQFMQYVPEDGLYVYFRYDAKQTVMVAMNTSKSVKTLDLSQYPERTSGFTSGYDVLARSKRTLQNISLGSYETRVIELLP